MWDDVIWLVVGFVIGVICYSVGYWRGWYARLR